MLQRVLPILCLWENEFMHMALSEVYIRLHKYKTGQAPCPFRQLTLIRTSHWNNRALSTLVWVELLAYEVQHRDHCRVWHPEETALKKTVYGGEGEYLLVSV